MMTIWYFQKKHCCCCLFWFWLLGYCSNSRQHLLVVCCLVWLDYVAWLCMAMWLYGIQHHWISNLFIHLSPILGSLLCMCCLPKFLFFICLMFEQIISKSMASTMVLNSLSSVVLLYISMSLFNDKWAALSCDDWPTVMYKFGGLRVGLSSGD